MRDAVRGINRTYAGITDPGYSKVRPMELEANRDRCKTLDSN